MIITPVCITLTSPDLVYGFDSPLIYTIWYLPIEI
jgi:hypothetical protein